VTVTNPGGLVSNFVFFPITAGSTSIAMAGKQVFPNCGAAVAGDFNGDGKLDVAWSDANSETVNILWQWKRWFPGADSLFPRNPVSLPGQPDDRG